ncbi:hypothetical protein CCMA1212_002463 [Trichoderma ghanense]|uniref:Uncharacterized protein n=1 Tax=Trichoderma ghanense TaxID=65468 RepID=A0ABY2HCT3_9HYPO
MHLARAVLRGEPTAPVHSDSIDKQPFGGSRAGVEMGLRLVYGSVDSQEQIFEDEAQETASRSFLASCWQSWRGERM